MEVHQQASIFFLSLTIPTVEDIEKATETTILKKKLVTLKKSISILEKQHGIGILPYRKD